MFTVDCDFESFIISSNEIIKEYDTQQLLNSTRLEAIERSWTPTNELDEILNSARMENWDSIWPRVIDSLDIEEVEKQEKLKERFARETPIKHKQVEQFNFLKNEFLADPRLRLYRFQCFLNRTYTERKSVSVKSSQFIMLQMYLYRTKYNIITFVKHTHTHSHITSIHIFAYCIKTCFSLLSFIICIKFDYYFYYFIDSLIAVSYTHLDVYKRQVEILACNLSSSQPVYPA